MSATAPSAPTEYERYLRVPELLALQKEGASRTHPDELLFQVVHQVEELWMKEADDEITRLVAALDVDQLELARFGLHRIFLLETLMSQQLSLLETLPPVAYFRIRAGLGHGSGAESPGFNRLLQSSKKVAESFARACQRRKTTAEILVREPDTDRALFAVAEAMIDVDAAFQGFRYRHLALVRRIIGQGTPSLKGNPIELLEKNVRFQFFPVLWAAREALFKQFEPGELKT